MNALDDRLRDIFRAVADTIDPSTVQSPDVRTQPRAISSRRTRFIAPFAAAAAVVAIVVTMTTLAAGRSGLHHRHHPLAVKTRPAAAPNLPAFTLAVLGSGSSLTVYNTHTGVAVATVKPPAGQQFEDVANGGTAGTYLAGTGMSADGAPCHAYFYRFQLSATGQPSRLTFLRSAADSQPTAIIGFPGGHTYAYSTVRCATAPNGGIGISGQAGNRTWDYPIGDDYAFSLSPTADGRTLAFSYYPANANGYYGPLNVLLNTQSHSATVAGASRTLSSVPVSPTLAISPDGRVLYTCVPHGSTTILAAYSTANGALIHVLHRWPAGDGQYTCQISTDSTGRFLLAAETTDVHQPYTVIGFDLRTNTSATVPIHPETPLGGTNLAW